MVLGHLEPHDDFWCPRRPGGNAEVTLPNAEPRRCTLLGHVRRVDGQE